MTIYVSLFTNSPEVMKKIEFNESTLSSKPAKDISTRCDSNQPPGAVNEDETYSKITLGTEPQILKVNKEFLV